MKIPFFIVDAFAEREFTGNPAGVCLLPHWLPTDTMQAIANENAVAATAFVVPEREAYGLRWFTPLVEEEMCGHATMGAAWVVLNRVEPARSSVVFSSPAGRLEVVRMGDLYTLDLPARPPHPCPSRLDATEIAAPQLRAISNPVPIHQPAHERSSERANNGRAQWRNRHRTLAIGLAQDTLR